MHLRPNRWGRCLGLNLCRVGSRWQTQQALRASKQHIIGHPLAFSTTAAQGLRFVASATHFSHQAFDPFEISFSEA